MRGGFLQAKYIADGFGWNIGRLLKILRLLGVEFER
jgi:hypothetical protein